MMLDTHDYRAILQKVPDLYLIFTPDLAIIEASDAYLTATMVVRENILGQELFDIFPANPNEPRETGTKNLKRSLQAVLKNKKSHAMEIQKYDIRRPKSEGGEFVERYWRPLNTPVLNSNNQVSYIIHRVEDVTEMVHLQRAGIERGQRLQLLIENIKDYSIIMLDTKGVIVSWNSGAESMTGYSSNDAIGKSISMLYPFKKPVQQLKKELQMAKTQGRYEEEGWRIRKDGTKFWANVILSPVYDIDGTFVGYGKVTRDLTARKKVEKIKNEFISVVNHELRTPLTSIVGSIRILQEKMSELAVTKTKQLLDIADSNCDRLMRLINDILDIESLETERMKINCKRYHLNKLITESIALNQFYAEQHDVHVIFFPDPTNLKVNTDRDRLIQVLTNLLSNAVKFAYSGSSVKITITKLKHVVRVAISNQGEGIPEAFKDRVFEKFSQANFELNRNKDGSGLGLSISKEIIERLGGTLQFTSELSKETVFYFDLPLVH